MAGAGGNTIILIIRSVDFLCLAGEFREHTIGDRRRDLGPLILHNPRLFNDGALIFHLKVFLIILSRLLTANRFPVNAALGS
jgi:hypothetical protein